MTDDAPLRPDEFRYLILALQRQGSRKLNALFAEIGLTNSQAETIEVLGEYGPISTREVGSYLVCESGSPSRLLATLSKKGLSVAAQSNDDKRLTLHALSQEGRAVLGEIKHKQDEVEAELAEQLECLASSSRVGLAHQLAHLVTDPELKGALQRRFPHLFHREEDGRG